MHSAGRGKPPLGPAAHPLPGETIALAAAPKCLEPCTGHLGAELRDGVEVAWHGVVVGMASDHACQVASLFRDG